MAKDILLVTGHPHFLTNETRKEVRTTWENQFGMHFGASSLWVKTNRLACTVLGLLLCVLTCTVLGLLFFFSVDLVKPTGMHGSGTPFFFSVDLVKPTGMHGSGASSFWV